MHNHRPRQFYWYNLLDWAMPVKNTANFVTKVR
jgi:protein Mpv17